MLQLNKKEMNAVQYETTEEETEEPFERINYKQLFLIYQKYYHLLMKFSTTLHIEDKEDFPAVKNIKNFSQ